MVSNNLPIVWDIKASKSLEDICFYIWFKTSHEQAGRVRNRIFSLVEKIQPMPEKYPKELLFEDQNINLRYIVAWSYKILFEIQPDKIIIIDIFHTSRNPSNMGK